MLIEIILNENYRRDGLRRGMEKCPLYTGICLTRDNIMKCRPSLYDFCKHTGVGDLYTSYGVSIPGEFSV